LSKFFTKLFKKYEFKYKFKHINKFLFYVILKFVMCREEIMNDGIHVRSTTSDKDNIPLVKSQDVQARTNIGRTFSSGADNREMIKDVTIEIFHEKFTDYNKQDRNLDNQISNSLVRVGSETVKSFLTSPSENNTNPLPSKKILADQEKEKSNVLMQEKAIQPSSVEDNEGFFDEEEENSGLNRIQTGADIEGTGADIEGTGADIEGTGANIELEKITSQQNQIESYVEHGRQIGKQIGANVDENALRQRAINVLRENVPGNVILSESQQNQINNMTELAVEHGRQVGNKLKADFDEDTLRSRAHDEIEKKAIERIDEDGNIKFKDEDVEEINDKMLGDREENIFFRIDSNGNKVSLSEEEFEKTKKSFKKFLTQEFSRLGWYVPEAKAQENGTETKKISIKGAKDVLQTVPNVPERKKEDSEEFIETSGEHKDTSFDKTSEITKKSVNDSIEDKVKRNKLERELDKEARFLKAQILKDENKSEDDKRNQ
jgi:hypothetical protein